MSLTAAFNRVLPGNSDRILEVTQASHNFSVGDAVYFDGTDWLPANSTAKTTTGIGLVSAVTNADNFVVAFSGVITGLSGLNAGSYYYVSWASSGALTMTEPDLQGVSNPILFALTTTTGLVLPYRPVVDAKRFYPTDTRLYCAIGYAANQGTWFVSYENSSDYGEIFSSSASLNDRIAWNIVLVEGVYSIFFRHWAGPDRGIVTFSLDANDGEGEVAINNSPYGASTGAVDLYTDPESSNNISTITGLVIPATRKYTLYATLTGKNASSTGYGITMKDFLFHRTS